MRQAEALADSLTGARHHETVVSEKPATRSTPRPAAAVRRPWGAAADLITLTIAAAGLVLAASGWVVLGGTVYFGSLLVFPFALKRKVRTLLPFSFASHIVASVAFFVVLLMVRDRSEVIMVGSVAFVVYHYVCIAVREERVRSRWSAGPIDLASRPVAYWFWVVLFAALSVVLLAGMFLVVIGWRG